MSNIVFNKEKCIKCGACAKDCITYSIEFDNEGFPLISQDGNERCISCQHCFAICPVGAITFDNKNEIYCLVLNNISAHICKYSTTENNTTIAFDIIYKLLY